MGDVATQAQAAINQGRLDWAISVMAVTMPAAIAAVLLNRWITGRSISTQAIQFTGLVLLVPTIVILALSRVLEASTVGTLLGGITGYVLSGVGSRDKDRRSSKAKEPNPDA